MSSQEKSRPGPRFPVLRMEDLSDTQRPVAESFLKFSLNGLNGPYGVLLRSPAAGLPILQLGQYIRFGTALPERLVELAILIHARLWTDQYEWRAHASRALKTGLAAAIVDNLRAGQEPAEMPADEAAVYRFCVELSKRRRVSEPTFQAVEAILGERGVVDLTIILGQYAQVSMLLSVAEAGSGGDEPAPLECMTDPFPID